MTKQEKHGQLIALGPGCYFLLTVWVQILGSQPADVKRLADATAISAPTIRKYLAKLRAFGYILPAGTGWQLAGNQAQLDFLGSNDGAAVPIIDLEADEIETGQPVDTSGETVDNLGISAQTEKKNFFSSISIINKESLNTLNTINTNSPEKNFFSTNDETGPNDETTQALKDSGIQLNVRTRRLLGRVTPDQVNQEFRKLRDYGRQKETGLLVTILEGVAEDNERAGRNYADWES